MNQGMVRQGLAILVFCYKLQNIVFTSNQEQIKCLLVLCMCAGSWTTVGRANAASPESIYYSLSCCLWNIKGKLAQNNPTLHAGDGR